MDLFISLCIGSLVFVSRLGCQRLLHQPIGHSFVAIAFNNCFVRGPQGPS